MDNQRLLLYLAFVFVSFLIWQTWQEQHSAKTLSYSDQPAATVPAEAGSLATAGATDVPQAAESVPDLPVPKKSLGQRIKVVTDTLEVEISTQGGNMLKAELLTFPISLQSPDIPLRLLDDTDITYLAQSGLIHDKIPSAKNDLTNLAPSHHALFSSEKEEYRLAFEAEILEVPLLWQGPDGITVRKVFTFHRNSFLVDINHEIINNSSNPWLGRQYRQLRHSAVREDDQPRFIYTYTGSAYYDGKYEKLAFDDMADEPLQKEISGGWAAVLQHYFVSAWIPKQEERNLLYSKVVSGGSGQQEYIIGLRSTPITIAPGENGVFNTQLYVGPKHQNQLSEIAIGLELVTDYGFLAVISKPLFWLLNYIHSWLGNWGWAIIILTVMIKLVFYKLSETSYRSMARMRSVQPRLLTLKERYAGDKQKMNQALMELYKKEKINPLGGCLPIAIQIPVFIALYWALLESVELRQAPFMFWIQDLSTKDPYFVLPVLMGVTMVAQQRLNPTPLDPIQAKVMMILPIVFTVFFAFFPAGLVLYWFVNNLLSIAQQWVITRRIEKAAS